MFLFSLLTNKDKKLHKLYNALTPQYSENGSGYPVLEPVLKLYNRFLGNGSYVKSLTSTRTVNAVSKYVSKKRDEKKFYDRPGCSDVFFSHS